MICSGILTELRTRQGTWIGIGIEAWIGLMVAHAYTYWRIDKFMYR